jgi:quercetin dioxygenase-like cupin family protein
MQLTPISPTAKGPADRFTGDVYVTPISAPAAPSYLAAGIVRFTPGARTNWHVHTNGQTLHILDGIALVGTRDGTVVRARAGETVTCTPGVDHWHGATSDTLMVHVAMVVASASHDGTDWLEPVSDREYLAAPHGSDAPTV